MLIDIVVSGIIIGSMNFLNFDNVLFRSRSILIIYIGIRKVAQKSEVPLHVELKKTIRCQIQCRSHNC